MGRLLRGGCPIDPNILLEEFIQPIIGPENATVTIYNGIWNCQQSSRKWFWLRNIYQIYSMEKDLSLPDNTFGFYNKYQD